MMRIYNDRELPDSALLARGMTATDVSGVVSEIISRVRAEGDAALYDYCAQFDGGRPAALEVSQAQWAQAVSQVDPDLYAVMEQAAENIRAFHSNQRRSGFVMTQPDGIVLGQRVQPLARVGLYVPGGTASYPSTVLMNGIPASIAGVPEIIMVTPAKNGVVNPAILAAAKLAGVHRVFCVGGAQAVAALAYGTQSIPAVDKIVGPGNAFVAEAKRQVFGQVAIDMIAGPSEILVVADGSCNAAFVAADLLSQAEHDRLAAAVLVTDSASLAQAVAMEVDRQLAQLPRLEIARDSIENNGKIIVTKTIKRAIEIANALAPEHLELCLDDPFAYLDDVHNAGSVFLGKYCPEALGDYLAGPNHTLPTMGTARFSSPLGVDDFVKRSAFTYYTPEALRKVSAPIARFARQEGLEAHARSAEIRVKD